MLQCCVFIGVYASISSVAVPTTEIHAVLMNACCSPLDDPETIRGRFATYQIAGPSDPDQCVVAVHSYSDDNVCCDLR